MCSSQILPEVCGDKPTLSTPDGFDYQVNLTCLNFYHNQQKTGFYRFSSVNLPLSISPNCFRTVIPLLCTETKQKELKCFTTPFP